MRGREDPDSNDRETGEMIRFGAVASVDLAARRITVDTGDVVTAPIRWAGGRAGATRTWSPPTVGEQVMLLCPEGDIAAGIALLGVSCTAYPEAGDSLRELIQFGDGAVIAYDPESHALEAVLPAGATVRIVAPGGVTLEADVTIQGNLTVDGDIEASGDVKAGDISLTDHVHGGVSAGGATTGAPQ